MDVPLRLLLVAPPPGVNFAVQRGRGAQGESVLVQHSTNKDIAFDISVDADGSQKAGRPNFKGPFTQGPKDGRFIYIGVGTYAGQEDAKWARRMKVPLQDITWALIDKVTRSPGHRLVARIPGTGKDGSPSCATVRLFDGWEVEKE